MIDKEELKKRREKNNELISGIPVDKQTAVTMAQIGAGFMPGGDIAGAGLELVSTRFDNEKNMQDAADILGENTAGLSVRSKAFKDYVNELHGQYGERLVNFGVMSAGSIAGTSLVALAFGPPGWIAGLLAAAGGGMAASALKEKIAPSASSEFLRFASQLQEAGQQGALSPEEAFVALTMNLPDPHAMKMILMSIPKEAGIRNMNDMVKALNTEEGRAYINQAMKTNDSFIRASTGLMALKPGSNASEQYAMMINSGKLAGVDLLNNEKTNHAGMMLNMATMQELQAQQHIAAHNPNVNLPHKPKGSKGRAGDYHTVA